LCSKKKKKYLNQENKSIGINNPMIAIIDTPHSLITGPPGIVKFDNAGIAYTIIQNCAPYPIWIEINYPLGFAEHHTEEVKSEQLDKRFIANLMHEVTKSSLEQEKYLKWTSEAKLKHIREHATNVPPDYKFKYENLILKHFKIVSIGKIDIQKRYP
jgi:hypothetical protein